MGSIDKYNFINVIEKSLLAELKPAIEERVTNELVKEFKKDIEPIVKNAVNKIVINGVNSIRDLANIRQEVKVYLEWKK